VKLFDTPRAPNPRRVRWVMAEKGISDIEIIPVDLLSGDHRQPAYRDKVGFPLVPALELDDGVCISESIAICRYLEALHPEPNLFGRTPEETAVIEMWMRKCEIYLANPLMMWVRLTHPALAALEPPKPEVAEYNLNTAERFMRKVDDRLKGREFIAADRLTMADIVALIGIDFGRLLKYRPPEELANLNRWSEALRARPAAKAGLPG
jgi:glutathione S-transferase